MPVIVIVVPLTRAVPVARAEQPDDIMLPVGKSIVKVMSSPDMVPTKDPAVRFCMPEPEKLMGPVTMDPFCVSSHVIVPMSVCPIMLPAPIELLESDPRPAHVPVTDIEAVGPDGAVGELPPHAAANHVNRTTAIALFIVDTFECTTAHWQAVVSSAPRFRDEQKVTRPLSHAHAIGGPAWTPQSP